MSKSKNKNSLLGGQSTDSSPKPAVDKILAMKYTMDRPAARIYPLNDKVPEKVYPDFSPCNEDDAKNDKLADFNSLNKGYFDSPAVSNEYFSARNLIQETIFSSSLNCTKILKELSLNLTKAYKARNEVINKIHVSSNEFRLPPRVTLTSMKKDAWLRDLANPDIPLQAISTKLPHGVRNKVLFDNLCSLSVPTARALWFTKCILASEQMAIRKKFSAKQYATPQPAPLPQLETVEIRWLQEWTSQVADYILKFAREMPAVSSPQKSSEYKQKLSYLLRLVQTFYVENLLDKSFFLAAIVDFLREDLPFAPTDFSALLELSKAEKGEESGSLDQLFQGRPYNYGQILVALTLVKIFWNDILESDYICKSLSESMLLNYMLIDRLQELADNDLYELPKNISHDLMQLLATSIKAVFSKNSNAFVLPNFWILIGGVLYDVLTDKKSDAHSCEEAFKLINFRNESLMLNMRYTVKDEASGLVPPSDESSGKFSPALDPVATNRPNDDILSFIDQLDKFKLSNTMAAMLAPTSAAKHPNWKLHLKILIHWAISVYRDMGPTKEKILTVSNFLKRKVLQPMNFRGSSSLKAEFENEILEIVFSLSDVPVQTICMQNLFVLVNELIQLKIITISSYFRKIIACGIFYISSGSGTSSNEFGGNEMEFHLALLSNLPAYNSKQYLPILKKWTNDFNVYSQSFERGIEISKLAVIDNVTGNSAGTDFEAFIKEVRGLNVGVKYLVANWVSSQIKSIISKSSKLIHLSRTKIANIYDFYANTNNLSLFFKVFLRFVLKNENKVIIFYLDTLYYMSKLIVHHMTLIKSLAGNNVDSVSSAYELFKLVIVNYKDLSSRETDIYGFEGIWSFMYRTVENSVNGSAKLPRKTGVGKYLYNKDTVESPLKIYEHSTRSNVKYSMETFQSDLRALLDREVSTLSPQEITDIYSELSNLGLNTLLEDLIGNHQIALSVVLDWQRCSSRTTDEEDIAFFKLVQNCCRSLKLSRPNSSDTVFDSLLRVMLSQNEVKTLKPFLKTILSFEIVSFPTIFALLTELKGDANAEVENVTFDLFFENSRTDAQMPIFECITFEILQSQYKAKHGKEVLMQTLHDLRSKLDHVELSAFNKYTFEVCKLVFDFLLSQRRYTIDLLTDLLPPKLVVAVCKHLLGLPEDAADGLQSLASSANEFSLPIFQILSRAKSSELTSDQANSGPEVLGVIDKLNFPFEESNSYFGELFSYLDYECGRTIFDYLENYLLTKIEFHQGYFHDTLEGAEMSAVSLVSTQSDRNLVPIFKDYFKKFSISCAENLQTTPEVFSLLSQFLQRLLVLFGNEAVLQQPDKNLHDVVSIFLRLLIIHKVTLTEIIASSDYDFGFLRSLVALLESRYMSMGGNEKLKILLYDLLLLMKSSLTQRLSLAPAGTPLAALGNTADDEKSTLIETEFGNNSTLLSKMSVILDLPETVSSNRSTHEEFPDCVVTLSEQELQCGSDLSQINNERLVLTSKEEPRTFSGQDYSPTKINRQFSIKSLELLQDTSDGLNNGFISLSLFDAYTTKENPY